MRMRRWMGIGMAGLVGMGGLAAVLVPLLQARQGPPTVQYDPATCHITNFESMVVAEVVEAGVVYLLVDTVSERGEYHQSVIVKDLAGCSQRTPVFVDEQRPGRGMPRRVAVEFAMANWRLAVEQRGKDWVERRLASADIGGMLQSLDIYSEDIAAFERMKIRYPKYLRGLDQFESWAKARAYYEGVFKDKSLPGCRDWGELQGKNHRCLQEGSNGD